MPVAYGRIRDGVLIIDRGYNWVRGDVSSWADANVKSFNRPLKVLEMDVVRSFVDVGNLSSMDTDKREAYTGDVNIMDIRLNENVVNV